MLPPERRGEEYAYLTTTGRRSGEPHTIEIWFAAADGPVYLISGAADRSDWVRNLLTRPRAELRVGDRRFSVDARPDVQDPAERAAAARLLHAKYGAQTSGTVDVWEQGAYFVALDIVD